MKSTIVKECYTDITCSAILDCSNYSGMTTFTMNAIVDSTHRQENDGSTWSEFQLQQSLVQVLPCEHPPREHGCHREVTVLVSHFLRQAHHKTSHHIWILKCGRQNLGNFAQKKKSLPTLNSVLCSILLYQHD